MDNCDSHGRSSSTGSEIKRVYEYSSRFCSAVVIYYTSFSISYPVFMKFPESCNYIFEQ